MELTTINKLYTYLERCKAGARIFCSAMDGLTKEEQLAIQEELANALAQSWQVDKIDMLAETNTTWR